MTEVVEVVSAPLAEDSVESLVEESGSTFCMQPEIIIIRGKKRKERKWAVILKLKKQIKEKLFTPFSKVFLTHLNSIALLVLGK